MSTQQITVERRADKPGLSEFECGYIAALATLYHSEGTTTAVMEMFDEIGRPTLDHVAAAGLSEFEADAIAACRAAMRGEG